MDEASHKPPATSIKFPIEPVLDGILEEDRMNVRNVLYVLLSLKLCKSWSALPKNQGYEVIGMLDSATIPEIELRELELLKRVDPLRISHVSVRMISGPPVTFSVVVFVNRKSEPIVLEEQDITVTIRKKRKFWDWSGRSSH
jgi:hypothetical protein